VLRALGPGPIEKGVDTEYGRMMALLDAETANSYDELANLLSEGISKML
jgi:uncharacterized protein YfbU (UPF0304 family)